MMCGRLCQNDERWAANVKFLDEVIARGDKVVVSNNALKTVPGSFFAREIEHLVTKGHYKIAEDGMSLSK